MRSNPADYQFIAPGSLQAVISLLGEEPGAWLPIAGGTDVMVQYAAGKLPARKLVSIWNLPELQHIEVSADEIRIGAGCTYTDLRKHDIVQREFSLLARAAAWTGGIANQNRGTLGGNIVNASPAADSLPALLAYEAELILVSVRGERRLSYRDFHTGYKKTKLAPDELIQAICLTRQFTAHLAYTRKVGARNAQAISKVCIAAIGRMAGGVIEDVRIALGSVAPVPLRLGETERLLKGKSLRPSLITLARKTAAEEIRPIDDIRSTAKYRAAVVANLVAEFIQILDAHGALDMSQVLARWNGLPLEDAANEILPCCGSQGWAHRMAAQRPFLDVTALLAASDETWSNLTAADWMEAFRSHPRIGESLPAQSAPASSDSSLAKTWSEQEQRKVAASGEDLRIAMAKANQEYEQRFGHIFIVCATGKSAPEILEILRRRLRHDEDTELREAAEQQRQITRIRMGKWLST